MMKSGTTRACLYGALAVGCAGVLYYLLSVSPLALDGRSDITASLVDSASSSVPISTSAHALVRNVPEGFREYRSSMHRFSLLYPEYLEVKERKESKHASTITFQNIIKAEGFQIFVVPFSGKQISPEQFKKDAPSGVREDMQNVTIDGALGASFHGFDVSLGDTSEVWFIKEPYLYEVTTVRQLEPLLQTIMNSWKFI